MQCQYLLITISRFYADTIYERSGFVAYFSYDNDR